MRKGKRKGKRKGSFATHTRSSKRFGQTCSSSYPSSLEHSEEVALFDEPCVMQLPLLVWIREVNLIVALESVTYFLDLYTLFSSSKVGCKLQA